MKILGQFSPFAAPLAVAFSFLLSSGNLRAFGPGGVGNTGSANGAGTTGSVGTGVAVSGGSRGGGVAPTGAARSVAPATTAGAHPGVAFSNSAPHLATGDFTRSAASHTNAPAAYFPGGRTVPPLAYGPQPVYRTPSSPTNAWSGTAVVSTGGAARRDPSPRQSSDSNGYTNNRLPGQHLDPGTFGANLTANHSSNNWSQHNRSRFPSRYYNYPYAYGPAYAPYIGYYGGYYGAYPYYADGTYPETANGLDNGTPTVTPQYTDQGRDASDGQPNPAPQPAPANQNRNSNVQPTVPNNGPDSLVEAVQEELIRRGYFAGKVDAMYSSDTKEALRKFQQDHHLADSGLINEATLHALQLD